MAKTKSGSPDKSPPKPAAPRAGGAGSAVRAVLSDPFRLVLALAVNLAVVVGIVSTAVILRSRKPPPKPVTLAMALSALDRGDTAEAQRLAERISANPDIKTEDWGGPDFILGTLAAQAATEPGPDRKDAFRQAALYLARSRERGFPEHRGPAGLYLLGKCLCRCDRLDAALPVLEQALPQNTEHVAEIRELLIEALVGVQPPELDKALAETQKLLADPQLAESERHEAFLQQARILIRMNRLNECAAALGKVPNLPSLRGEISLLRGRIALREGQALKKAAADHGYMVPAAELPKDAKEKFRSAGESFRRAFSLDQGDGLVARQASYLIGLCLTEQGDLPAALRQMERTAELFPATPESFAALFQQAEIARGMGRQLEAGLAYRRLLSAYSRPEEFHNPWISLAQLKASLLSVCQEYLKAEAYKNAIELSGSLVHLLPKAEALELTARIYRTWGDNLLDQAERVPPDKAEELRKQARAELRRAGDSYTVLAREVFASRQYPEQLWNSAGAYLAGHDFRTADATLRLYIHNESRLRHAQALVDLGECELSLGRTEEALKLFQACIEQHPRDVAVYRARLLASRAAAGMGNLKQAEASLQDNLNGDQLTPASKEWRDSLFALAELLRNAGRHREAIQRLDETLQRYPESRQAVVSRYLLADSARRLAAELRASAAKEISSAVRNNQMAECLGSLHRALNAYAALQENLSRREAESLTAQETAILRNVRFALGDTYVELEQYPQALRAYQSAANHYAASPEVLDAYLQIANIYRRMDRPAEARTSLEQARLALRRIPSEARFEQTTSYNRQQWGELLDRLCSL
jgi:tetratricopeptide (TPR) repeat protein